MTADASVFQMAQQAAQQAGQPAQQDVSAAASAAVAESRPHFSARQYSSEALGGPFVIEAFDGTIIKVARPSGAMMLDLEEAESSSQVLHTLLGDQYQVFMDKVACGDFKVMMDALNAIREHFGLGE